jgi:isocitrate dehydrogenase
MPNLYGDIVSDIAAQIAGSVGLGGSANIGLHGAMFEAIHGSAPTIAGQNSANPSGLLLAAVQMLVHINQSSIAEQIHNAWLKTLEDGIHTPDIFVKEISQQVVGTREFAQAVIERLGQMPQHLKPVTYGHMPKEQDLTRVVHHAHDSIQKALVGVDVFIQWTENVDKLAAQLECIKTPLELKMISNRGVKVWPEKQPETSCVDIWRCRFATPEKNHPIFIEEIQKLLASLQDIQIEWTQVSNLYTFNGQPGYTLAQDEQ